MSTTADALETNIKTVQIYPTDNNTWDVLNDGNMTVSAAILKHRVICFGYVMQETEKPGSLNVNLLKSKGISPGPLYAKIKRGESIYAEDGSEIKPEDVLGPPYPGRKVVVLGDTCDSQQITDLAMDADVLIHEATNENAHKEKCIENGHSTPGIFPIYICDAGYSRYYLGHPSRLMFIDIKTPSSGPLLFHICIEMVKIRS